MELSNKQIIFFLRYFPVLVISILTITFIVFNINKLETALETQKEQYRLNYTNVNKNKIKTEVNTVVEQIQNNLQTSKDELKLDIKSHVSEAHQIMKSIYNKNKDTKNKNEIIMMMKDALRDIRFYDGRGYFFIHQMDGINLLHPILPNREGVNISLRKDKNGVQRFMVLKDAVLNKDGYESFLFFYPHDKTQQREKLIYAEHFEPYDLMIGSGEYLDDFENNLKEKYISKLKAFNNKNFSEITVLKDLNIENTEINEFLRSNKKSIFVNLIVANDNLIIYMNKIEGYNVAIAKGFSFGELEKEILLKHKAFEKLNGDNIKFIILTALIISIISTIISFIISKYIERKFLKYEQSIILNEKTLHEQSKMVSMGEMIGNIAHQWRQPLSVVSTVASGVKMSQEYGVLKDQDIPENMDLIIDNVDYLSNTIDTFRNFIKGDRVQQQFEFASNCEEFISLIRGSLKYHDITININNDENIILNGYPNELIQCYMILFNNSKDAFESNKVDERFIFIEALKKDKEVIIEFKDNAGGIAEDIINRVFEPYFTTKHSFQGTGLGLSMTYQLITEGMNGVVEVENSSYEYNKMQYDGAKFTIRLPV